MEPVTIHPPVTALRDVLALAGWTGVVTLIWYGMTGTQGLLTREAISSVLGGRASEADMQAAPLTTDQLARLRRFHFSWPVFLLGCLPMLMIVMGNVGCSLLRDAGYLIFPWPVMLNGAACGASFYVVLIVRRRFIRRLLLVQPA